MMLRLLPLLLLASCKSLPVNCDSAERIRVAAALALQALDRACPAYFSLPN